MEEEYSRMKLSQQRRERKEKWEHFKLTGYLPEKKEPEKEDFIASLRERTRQRMVSKDKAKIEVSHLSRQRKH